MTMGEMQLWSARSFAFSLRIYALEEQKPWYVASMLPVTFPWPLSPICAPSTTARLMTIP